MCYISFLLAFLPVILRAQQPSGPPQEITGTVRDTANNRLALVNVVEIGTHNATITDREGNFKIKAQRNATLVFSMMGYTPRQIKVDGQTVIMVSLVSNVQSLGDVVVIGYGTQRKVDVTGSVGSINSLTIKERPSPNALGALSGRVPGLSITNNSGRPGDYRISIRGFNSINASNNPLFVVDGVIGVDYSTINPNDIETIDVLKDASSTAIYGARGSGGVIIITTRRGLDGKASANYNFTGGYNTLPREIPLLNSTQYQAMEKAAYAYVPGRPYPNFATLEPDLYKPDGTPRYNTNWQKEVYKPTFSQNHNLSVTGGNKDLRYSMNYGYQDDEALLLLTYNKKYSARINLDAKVNDWLSTGLNLAGTYFVERIQDDGVGGLTATREVMEAFPMIPVKLPNGSWGGNYMHLASEGADNPVNILRTRYNMNNRTIVLGNTYFNIHLSHDLDFRTSMSAQINTNKNNNASSGSAIQRGLYQNISAGVNADKAVYWQSSSYFTYKKVLNEVHSFNAVLGAEWAKTNYESVGAFASKFDGDFYLWNNLGAATAPPNPPSSNAYDWQINSYFARLIYSFKNKYLFTGTGRYDGSSKFGANHKYAFFPSAALAWRVSEEDFLKGNKVISNLKLRATYGSTGNSEIGQYQSISSLASNTAIFNGTRAGGEVQGSIPNPDLKWEKTNQADFGVDLGLFNDRINITADVYNKVTKDLLLYAPVPSSSGYDNVLKNIGSVRNRGFELGLNTSNLIGKFKWNTILNLSVNRNKILALGTHNEDIFPGPGFLDQTNILRVGEQVGTFFGLVREGVWGTKEAAKAAQYNAKPGDLKEKDLNGDGKIDGKDRTVLGHAYPKYEMEFINRFSYKNFDLVIDLQVSRGNSVLNLGYATSEDRQILANSYATVLNAWTTDNQNTNIAQVRLNADGPSLRQDSHYLEDGSFIRGKNISLAYNLPSEISRKLHLNSLRLFAGIQNAFLITKYKYGYDPEVSTYSQPFAYGIEFYALPKARTFNAGVNVIF